MAGYINDYDINCCGISELADIMIDRPGRDSDWCCEDCDGPRPKESRLDPADMNEHIMRTLDAVRDFSGAFLIFSDNGENRDNYQSGRELVKAIKKYKLGTVVSTRPRMNGNSGNILKAWLWGVDRDAVRRREWRKP